MSLTYHQAAFDLMGKKPRLSKRAIAVIEQREQALGITLPASLKEFYAIQGACTILAQHSDHDQIVPLETLGDPEELAHGVIRIQDESQGVATWYVRLDASEDPPVELETEFNHREPPEGVEDWTVWDVAEFERVADRFSEYIYQRVLTFGGSREDRKAAAGLAPYGACVAFNERGRAVRAYFSNYQAGKPGVEQAEPLDAVAMGLVRKLERLEWLSIGSRAMGPGGWAALRDHPGISRLDDFGALDDTAVEHVIAMPALRALTLSRHSDSCMRLTEMGLSRLLRGRQLASLEISGTVVMNKWSPARALAALDAQVGLESLELNYGNSKWTDDALAVLGRLVSLKMLSLAPSGMSDHWLRPLAGLSGLEALFLRSRRISDAGLVHLAGLTNLTTLVIDYSPGIKGTGLRHLSGLRELRMLKLTHNPIDDEALAHVAGLTNLEELNLCKTRVVGPGLRFLSGLAKLRKLDCLGNPTTDEGMAHLAASSSLENIKLWGAKITDKGLRALAPLRTLRVLDLTGTTVSAAAIQDLKDAIPALREVRWTPPGYPPHVGTGFFFRAKRGKKTAADPDQ